MDIRRYNRQAWDRSVDAGDEWTRPVDSQVISAARRGEWQIYLTRQRPVPRLWFPPLEGLRVLCLAGGGGQQGPVLAAAGAKVIVFDNSPAQLRQDRLVAERDGLEIETVEGDMAGLSAFSDGRFDLIVHPVSNLFVPSVRPVWREAYRVLVPGGLLLAGFMNPAFFMFDRRLMDDKGVLRMRHPLPYADPDDLTPAELAELEQAGWPLEFGHSLTDQIAGQIEAGFVITGFYEDHDDRVVLSRYMPIHLATRALKPAG